MNEIQQAYHDLSKQPVEQLFAYVTEKESSTRRHIALFLIQQHLSRYQSSLQAWHRRIAVSVSFLALVVSVIALSKK